MLNNSILNQSSQNAISFPSEKISEKNFNTNQNSLTKSSQNGKRKMIVRRLKMKSPPSQQTKKKCSQNYNINQMIKTLSVNGNSEQSKQIVESLLLHILVTRGNKIFLSNVNINNNTVNNNTFYNNENSNDLTINKSKSNSNNQNQEKTNLEQNADEFLQVVNEFNNNQTSTKSTISSSNNVQVPLTLLNEYSKEQFPKLGKSNKEDLILNSFTELNENSPCIFTNNFMGNSAPGFPGIDNTPSNFNILFNDVNNNNQLKNENMSFTDFVNGHAFFN